MFYSYSSNNFCTKTGWDIQNFFSDFSLGLSPSKSSPLQISINLINILLTLGQLYLLY